MRFQQERINNNEIAKKAEEEEKPRLSINTKT
jgi:hypothetical protein